MDFIALYLPDDEPEPNFDGTTVWGGKNGLRPPILMSFGPQIGENKQSEEMHQLLGDLGDEISCVFPMNFFGLPFLAYFAIK